MSERRIGLGSAVALVVASMIGTGVFTTSGFALGDLGRRDLVVAAWVVGGLVALAGAASYGALARHIPEDGGEYTFLSQTLHPALGVVAGWVSMLAGFTAPIAAAALLLHEYLAGSFAWPLGAQLTATLAIVLAAAAHGLRTRHGLRAQDAAVALKLLALTTLLVVGFALRESAPPPPADGEAGGWGAFAVTLVWVSFSYSGWNAAVYVGGRVRDPARTLPRALVLGTGLVALLYVALNALILYSAPQELLAYRPDVAAAAAGAIGGETAQRGLALVVTLGLLTSISAMTMLGPRVVARMAEDGALPRVLARGADAPTTAVAAQALAAIVVVWLQDLQTLLGYIGFTLGLSAAGCVVGLMALRRRRGPEEVPVWGYPFVPLFFVLATLWGAAFMVAREPTASLYGALTLGVGGAGYAWRARSKPRP